MKKIILLLIITLTLCNFKSFSQYYVSPQSSRMVSYNTSLLYTDCNGSSKIYRGNLYEIKATTTISKNTPIDNVKLVLNNGSSCDHSPKVTVTYSGDLVTFTSYISYLWVTPYYAQYYPGNLNQVKFAYRLSLLPADEYYKPNIPVNEINAPAPF